MRVFLLLCAIYTLCVLECFLHFSVASMDLELKFTNKRRGKQSHAYNVEYDDEDEELATVDGNDREPASEYTNGTEEIQACVRCSAPCQGYCCQVPPYRYCIYYNGRCFCGR